MRQMRKYLLFALLAVSAIGAAYLPQSFSSPDESKWLAEESKLRKAVDDLSSAIMANDPAKVRELTYIEGANSSKTGMVDQLLLKYDDSGTYRCSQIELIFIRLAEDMNHAEVCVRVHLEPSQKSASGDSPQPRIESWNFAREDEQWLCLIPRQ